ncbi:MAG: SDR family oxidoreductase [Oricola sp.]
MSGWLQLEGKVTVVTGGAGGIGRAIGSVFHEAGAHVAVLERELTRAEEYAAELGGDAIGLGCDVGNTEAVEAANASLEARLGPCDILVNNAGFLKPGALEDVDPEDWDTMLRVNLTGCLICAQTFGRAMLARGSGALVHIASIAATQPQPFSNSYSPGKAGVAMLSRQLAFEWGPRGVRSNSVSPGLVRTPLSEPFYQVPGIKEKRAAMVPSRRIGRPEDIGNAVAFLASPRAGYVNGQDLVVDGGLSQTLMSLVPRPGFGDGN